MFFPYICIAAPVDIVPISSSTVNSKENRNENKNTEEMELNMHFPLQRLNIKMFFGITTYIPTDVTTYMLTGENTNFNFEKKNNQVTFLHESH